MSPFITLAAAPAPALASFRFLAQTPPPAPAAPAPGAPQAGGGLAGLAFPLLLLGVFFIFIIGPQSKKAKEHKKLIEELKQGDEVVTSSGIYGTITQVKPDRFVVEVAKGVKMEIRRTHVEARAPDSVVEVSPAEDKKL